jgi:integrase/recombinase XerD
MEAQMTNWPDISTEQLVEQFIRERRYLKNITLKTEIYYRNSWDAYKRYTGSTELSKAQLTEWVVKMREKGIKPVTCNTWISGINAFCNWLYENSHLPERLKLSKLKVEKGGRKTLDESVLRTIIRYKPTGFVQTRLKTLLLLLMDTGLRIDEALTLSQRGVDFDNVLITVMGKGRKQRTIPMSYDMKKILYKHLKGHKHDLVFCTRHGGKLSVHNLYRDYCRLCEILKIEKKGAFHAFRHTFAYNYTKTFARVTGNAENGVFHLQQQLGHSDLNTTKIYVDLQPEDLREAQAMTSILSRLR